jgi:hypothetical protein
LARTAIDALKAVVAVEEEVEVEVVDAADIVVVVVLVVVAVVVVVVVVLTKVMETSSNMMVVPAGGPSKYSNSTLPVAASVGDSVNEPAMEFHWPGSRAPVFIAAT